MLLDLSSFYIDNIRLCSPLFASQKGARFSRPPGYKNLSVRTLTLQLDAQHASLDLLDHDQVSLSHTLDARTKGQQLRRPSRMSSSIRNPRLRTQGCGLIRDKGRRREVTYYTACTPRSCARRQGEYAFRLAEGLVFTSYCRSRTAVRSELTVSGSLALAFLLSRFFRQTERE